MASTRPANQVTALIPSASHSIALEQPRLDRSAIQAASLSEVLLLSPPCSTCPTSSKDMQSMVIILELMQGLSLPAAVFLSRSSLNTPTSSLASPILQPCLTPTLQGLLLLEGTAMGLRLSSPTHLDFRPLLSKHPVFHSCSMDRISASTTSKHRGSLNTDKNGFLIRLKPDWKYSSSSHYLQILRQSHLKLRTASSQMTTAVCSAHTAV